MLYMKRMKWMSKMKEISKMVDSNVHDSRSDTQSLKQKLFAAKVCLLDI